MANVDFVFSPAEGYVLAVGWARRDTRADPPLLQHRATVAPIGLVAFPRSDLAGCDGQGVLWLYDRVPGLELGEGRKRQRLTDETLFHGLRLFLRKSVDQAFFGTLMAMAKGEIPLFDRACPYAMEERLRSREHSCYEGAQAALGLERADVCPVLGFGLLQGWALRSAHTDADLAAIAFGPQAPSTVALAQGTLSSDHLKPFAKRYQVSGADGFVGRIPAAGTAAQQILVLEQTGDGDITGIAIECQAQGACEMAEIAMKMESRANWIGGSIMPTLARLRARPPVPFDSTADASEDEVHVFLDADTADIALRDVLRALSQALERRFTVYVTRTLGPWGHVAVHSALGELGPDAFSLGGVVDPASMDSILSRGGWVLAVSGSTVLQLEGLRGCVRRSLHGDVCASILAFAPHARLLGGHGLRTIEETLHTCETGVAIFTRAEALTAASFQPGSASVAGEVRARLLALRKGGAKVSLELDLSRELVPGYGGPDQIASRFDLSLLRAEALS